MPATTMFRVILVGSVFAGALASCRPSGSRELSTGLDRLTAPVDTDLETTPTERPRSAQLDADDLRTRESSEMLRLLEEAQRNSQISLESSEPAGSSIEGPTEPESTLLNAAPSQADAEANRAPIVALEALLPPDEDQAIDTVAATTSLETPIEPDPLPELSPAQRFDQARGELHAQLEERALTDSPAPASQLVRLAALELATGQTAPAPESRELLSVRERAQLEAWRDFVRDAGRGLESAEGIESLRSAASSLAQALEEWDTLTIAKAAMCRRVEGFGIYDEIARFDDVHKFLAGRPVKFLVYVELDRITHTSVSKDGVWGYEVDLALDLRLYHRARGGDTLVWRLPDQPVSDFSRNRRRDFFLVQLIELPSTLNVGGYQLKIAIRDGASGEIAERIVPIEVVAHAQALQED